ncbi:Mth938-like domain-containing protein [Roseibacterium sp. SDUM158017]|uniref:Mth938-like domain-containing protein n=1 Tax=Roseicyclus salinarum TaxID=3036773 RepID=UPI002415325C|nr:Mth938-like domain-containing protein [Roseibacterium sp. SDUM158017]MDG4649153.1 Mth938-like domain-containing protein [Roseibacterium sp. SDUM158017]
MRITEVDFGTGAPVDGYGPGYFRVNGAVVEGAALILPGATSRWDGYEAVQPILAAAGSIDFLIVGTGDAIAHPPPAFRKTLEDAGIGVEPMASAAACRTYNVLLSEGRRVGAALLPVS